MAKAALLAGAVLLALAPPRVAGTPVPPPGPGCTGGTPVANQSGPVPDCAGLLMVHNASCAGQFCTALTASVAG